MSAPLLKSFQVLQGLYSVLVLVLFRLQLVFILRLVLPALL